MDYKKIPYFKLIPIIIISFILYKVIDNIEYVTIWLRHLLSLINYFIWGWLIAFLLNPLMVLIEKRFKLKRFFSIIIVYTLFLGIITLAITLISPRISKNIVDLLEGLPNFISNVESWINNFLYKYRLLDKFGLEEYFEKNLNSIIKQANSLLSSVLNLVFSRLINFTSTLFKLITGIVISVYMLKDKEEIIKFSKKIIFSFFSEERGIGIIDMGRKINKIFSQYIIGRLIDSLIITFICIILLSIFKMPYSLLISIIIGITNMIPYFGNIIGMVPACIITLFVSPAKALELAIFIAVLSQLDGWFLSPRIIGEKVGLNPLLIILAMALGGGFFGLVGLFFSVPIMAVVKIALEEYTNNRLKSKNIDISD